MAKKIISIIMSMIIILPTVVFADDPFSGDNSYQIISNVSKTVLSVLSWFGYVTAFGILICIGIKYMMSAANERAKLKETFAMYLAGVVMILLCSTIAKGVADVASSVGDNSAEGIVDKGLGFKDIDVGNIVNPMGKVEWVTRKEENGIVTVKLPQGSDYTYSYENKNGVDPVVYFPETSYGEKFLGVIVEVRNVKGELIGVKHLSASDTKEETSSSELWFGSESKWEKIDGKYKFEAEFAESSYADTVRKEYTLIPLYENMKETPSYLGEWNTKKQTISIKTNSNSFVGEEINDCKVIVNKPKGINVTIRNNDDCVLFPREIDGKKLLYVYQTIELLGQTVNATRMLTETEGDFYKLKIDGTSELWPVYEGMEAEAALRFNY